LEDIEKMNIHAKRPLPERKKRVSRGKILLIRGGGGKALLYRRPLSWEPKEKTPFPRRKKRGALAREYASILKKISLMQKWGERRRGGPLSYGGFFHDGRGSLSSLQREGAYPRGGYLGK